jgi:DNA-binding MarR family transcriptional regulator
MAHLAHHERVLVHLFRDGHHRNVVALARAIGMDQGAVKNHLDRLVEAKLARLKVAQGHLYWGITDEGRRHVAERGLIQDAAPAPTL